MKKIFFETQILTMLSRLSIFGVPFLAAIVYGSWAAFANSEYTLKIMLKAGFAQAGYAFFSTLMVTEIAKKICMYFGMGYQGFFISFVLTFLIMLSIPLVVHEFLMTPDTWQAILPGLIWGSLYILIVLIFFSKSSA